VSASGTRKAAMLLRCLDSATAAELLKSAKPEKITEIAGELAYLSAAGHGVQPESVRTVKEFSDLLDGQAGPSEGADFLKSILAGALGEQKSHEVFGRAREIANARDPFLPIRSAAVKDVARALEGESPLVVAVVLGGLPSQRSAELLALLDQEVRTQAIGSMVSGETVSPEARLQIASAVRDRLVSQQQALEAGGEGQVGQRDRLRQVAVLLRGLSTELRDGLIQAISERDETVGSAVQDLMVTWEDLPSVADRPLQEGLRSIEVNVLALALVEAEESIASKIRANISERAASMVDEENSLMSSPQREEVQEAREKILNRLREMNSRGELSFEEDQGQ